MKKYFLIIVIILTSTNCFSQNPEIKTDLPTIIPPSPTVAALMKFEEVPVSNYTGVPNISIPLFASPTLANKININLSLNYHSGIGASDVASDVGLGWSLIAGGTISRTVRGLPDEQLQLDGGQASGKVGIYHTSINNHINHYYNHYYNLEDASEFASTEPYLANRYLWETSELGKFDTEHDLWQFNFMNNSGRFIIEKDMMTDSLHVIPLDDYRIKIINHYTSVGINNYVPNGFTIYDENGYEYLFEEFEITSNSQAVSNTYATSNTNSTPSNEKEYRSAFHLTKIYDSNHIMIAQYIYSNAVDDYVESQTNSTYTFNDYYADGNQSNGIAMMSKYNCFNEFKPILSISNSLSRTRVKKIKNINVTNISKIEISYTKGRDDSNITLKSKAVSIDKITIRNWSEGFVKKIKFGYGYSTVKDTRMILERVDELNEDETDTNNTHEFFYRQNDTLGYNIGKDAWGYFNLIPSCSIANIDFINEPTPSFSTSDLLQKIKYPSGGSVIFEFEANTYSFIGDQEITNFDENQNNYHQTFYNPPPGVFNDNNPIFYEIPIATVDRKAKFSPSVILANDAVDNLILQKYNGSSWQGVRSLYCLNDSQCCYEVTLIANTPYRIYRSFTSTEPAPDVTVEIQYFEKNSVLQEYLYGGGNRIKEIKYFDEDVPQNFFQDAALQNQYSSKKQKKYDYSWPDNSNKSSGSLAYLKPLMSYYNNVFVAATCPLEPYFSLGNVPNLQVSCRTYTSFNNLSPLKTSGSDIGYKHVRVYEPENGNTFFEYKSPIDEPEVYTFTDTPPFMPSKNIDYKRGLILKETVKSSDDRKLSESVYDYQFQSFEKKYGIRIHKPEGTCFGPASILESYNNYILGFLNSALFGDSGQNNFSCSTLCGYPLGYLKIYPLVQSFGWAKLSSKTTKNYFYDQNNVEKIVETNETYQYNPVNKMISESTVSNSLGETKTTKYFYHTGNSAFSQNRIAEIERIETYKGSELLSTSQINYNNNWNSNVSFLPETIATSKGTNALENRVRYTKYDEFGHPLELQQENGTFVSYIWGYNKTQPIAKIENATNQRIIEALGITDINSLTEANMSAINNLRNTLLGSMITTYTYIPLVGVETVTDPKGDTARYTYDSFGRLQAVYDGNNNKLSENQYHYKTQN